MNDICTTISPEKLKELLEGEEKVELIDVRNLDEFMVKRLPSARLIPLPELDLRYGEIDTDKEVYVICKSGKRSRQACETLKGKGINAAYMEGGLEAWQKAGYSLLEGKKKVSIDRQTRIAIGSLVLLGLSVPFLWWLPWFVSIMLIFAGISDTCMMMSFIAKMPWNKG